MLHNRTFVVAPVVVVVVVVVVGGGGVKSSILSQCVAISTHKTLSSKIHCKWFIPNLSMTSLKNY